MATIFSRIVAGEIPCHKVADMYFGGAKLSLSQEELAEIAKNIRNHYK